MNGRWGCSNKRAFTLVELLIVIAIIGILGSLLLPALAKAKAAGKTTVCQSNLKQFSLALQSFVFDEEFYPRHDDLTIEESEIHQVILPKYIGCAWTNAALKCPDYKGKTWDLN